MRIYNSLVRELEEFKPLNSEQVSMYTCGPTVYSYVSIGNFRTYMLSDLFHRLLEMNGYKVKFVMNLTDVGHLTGDNEGDPDIGEDRMEKSALKEGKSVSDITQFYIDDFLKSYDKLNYKRPLKFTKATDYIKEQIELIKILESKEYTYLTSDGVYFDTSKFSSYGQLSGLTSSNVLEGARVEVNPEKKNPTDFALWKFSPKEVSRLQEWTSPWGIGFPGWHLECSAMCLTELGETVDIHIGGEDLKMIHHQNEIAQSESATGKKFVRYWVHGAHMMVDGKRMGKSLGNAFTLSDVESRGYNPMSLRYFYMTAHYRTQLNFTWDALTSAQNSLRRVYDLARNFQTNISDKVDKQYLNEFYSRVNDDLNMPEALSVMWEMLKSNLDEGVKFRTLLEMDTILGLDIEEHLIHETPQRIVDMARMRQEYRKAGIWDKADSLRKQILENGYDLEDLPNNDYKIKRKL